MTIGEVIELLQLVLTSSIAGFFLAYYIFANKKK